MPVTSQPEDQPTAAPTQHGYPVTLEEVSRRYQPGGARPVTALDQVSLHIPAGQAVTIYGPSGSGKSTLLHLIGAMDRPDTGQLTVGGWALHALPPSKLTLYRRTIGFVFQRFHLLPALSALDNVLAPVLPRRTGFDKTARARELLTAVGLAGRETALPGQLSGGQQQRVAIARALINTPRILLADEPTGNLDTATGGAVITLLHDLARDHGYTMITASHDPAIAERSHRTIRIRDGVITADNAT